MLRLSITVSTSMLVNNGPERQQHISKADEQKNRGSGVLWGGTPFCLLMISQPDQGPRLLVADGERLG